MKHSPTALASHLSCAHLTQLERLRRAGALKIPFPTDPRIEAQQERGRRHEAAYVERLRKEGRTIADLTERQDPAATLDAMHAGHGAIVQATLTGADFSGVADVLVRCETPSALGAWSYEPVDTKLSRETRASTILQLATYCELVTTAQGTRPQRFHVITPVADETYRVDDFAAYFRLARAGFLSACAVEPAPSTYPDPVTHCDVCKYWKHCGDQRRADDHPSLIAGIRGGHVREFQAQDIPTVAAIAQRGGALPKPPKRGRRETYISLGQQAKLQVEARALPTPPLEYLPLEPGKGFARLPDPSPGDIFLDFEGDPFVGEHGLEYLTGFHVREAGTVNLTQLWALNGANERSALEAFIDFAMARWGHYPDLHIYHFGAYEPAALKRLCARYATRDDELDRFLRSGRFVDLHTVVREAMRIGIERYGLKELEVLHAFARQQDLAEAGVSRRDVELALELGDAEGITEDLRTRVAAYNAEDCASTESLRDWLEARRAEQVAAGAVIDRPPNKVAAPTEEVGERDERIQSLKEALSARLPNDAASWSDEDHATALLASMLGYFRQEEKNAWWEHFRLRDLPVDEQMDEREMLAGLDYVETVAKEKGKKSERRRYRFPQQESAIKDGDKVFFTLHDDPKGPDGKATRLVVEEIDFVESTVLLSSTGFATSSHPTAVLGEQVVGAERLERSLLAFAEHVCAHGFSNEEPYAASTALLLRKSPPTLPAHSDRLRAPGEGILDAAKRLARELDNEVLPIQGPPGSGKTYTGARTILDLVRRGRRVGVTAVSHKVIDNLLEAIREAAAKERVAVRLVHKDEDGNAPGIEYIDKPADALGAIGLGTVVGGTVWLWAGDDAAGALDDLFVDEAGQMALAPALAAARAARNVILLGDPQQLEQPQRGAHPPGADIAALVHLVGAGRQTLADDRGLFLDATWRLHPAICEFTSELYYEGRLQAAQGRDRQRVGGASPFAGSGRLFLVEVAHEGNQAVAAEEVDAIAGIARTLLGPGATWTDHEGATRPLVPDDILVVAPYNAQVSALRRDLEPIGVKRLGTVDRFQGQEAPIVIYSCTSSSPEDAPRGMAFLYDPHRFNVATSRAQGVVIVVASPHLFEPDCRTPEQMRWANGFCRYREMATRVGIELVGRAGEGLALGRGAVTR